MNVERFLLWCHNTWLKATRTTATVYCPVLTNSQTQTVQSGRKGLLDGRGSRFLGLAVLYTSQAFLRIPSLFPPRLTYENGADLLHDFHPFTTCYSFFFGCTSLTLAENSSRLTWIRQSSRKSSATRSYQCVRFCVSQKQRYPFLPMCTFLCVARAALPVPTNVYVFVCRKSSATRSYQRVRFCVSQKQRYPFLPTCTFLCVAKAALPVPTNVYVFVRRKSSATRSYQCVRFCVSRQRYGCQCLGFLTCSQRWCMLYCTRGLYGHRKRVCTESWLWEKNPLPDGASNPRQHCTWLFSQTLYQLSWPRSTYTLRFYTDIHTHTQMCSHYALAYTHPSTRSIRPIVFVATITDFLVVDQIDR